MKLLIVVIALLVLSTGVEALPVWTQNSVSVQTGSQYSPGRNYGFEINWTDAAGISTVILEWNGGSYAALKTGDVYYYNFTSLPAGPYSYRWFANNTVGESAYSDIFTYNVEKNTSASFILKLNGTEGNRSYNRYSIAEFTSVLNIPGQTIFLDSNYPGLSVYDENSTIYYVINLTTEGSFTLSSVWNGNDNYTGTSKTYYFDTSPPRYYGIASSPSDHATYEQGAVYFFNISWTDATLTEVRFESNFSGSKKNYTKIYNDSELFWINISDIPVRDFTYRWHAKDDLNNWNATDQRIYRIFKGYALELYSPFTEVVRGTTTVFNCYSLSSQIDVSDFKFYRDSILINNTTSLSRSDISILPVGFYKYVCNTSGNKNYSNQTLISNLTVTLPESTEEVKKMELKISNISSPSVYIGQTGQGTFNLSSTWNETISGISVEISGIDNSLYTLEGVPSALLEGGSVIIRINFDIPPTYEEEIRNLTLRVVGKKGSSTIILTDYMLLRINRAAPPQNLPPSSSSFVSEVLGNEAVIAFSIYDDKGISGYIFSINDTGTWINDSWVPAAGTVEDVNFTRTLSSAGSVAWKAYFNDTDNVWSVSQTQYLMRSSEEFSWTVPIVIVISLAAVAVAFFFIQKMRSKENKRKVLYVYSKEDR